ncbi:PREDICTED: plasminogen-like [Branchiostoma belcheri]|uniref:Plasminogen-like n=1 Tax=Branchiostoma belcheri TaxID=7741 RepID=A0A6P4Y7E4_BRABE|nr:PREDICTED: plasminogen-like [Branchiostoma belcheri]
MGGEYRIRVSMKLLVFVLWLWMGNSALTVKQADHLKDRLKRLKTKIEGVNLKVAQTAGTLNNMAERGFPKVPDVPTATPGSVSNNHPGYTEREGSFYKVFRYQTDHASAQQTCEADGGRLADVKTEALNNFIVELISATGNAGDNSYWIGLNDKATEGTYMWADGSRLASCAFSNWAPGEPNNGIGNEITIGQDCIQLWRDYNYKWDDDHCWLEKHFICQIESCQEGNGATYRGSVSMTATGKTCQRWDSQTPHGHDRTPANYPSAGLEQNYCRNPDGWYRLWCYTTDPYTRWELCDVPFCSVTKKWRDDLLCGDTYTTADGRTAECDPDGIYPCCSPGHWCGNTADHCDCAGCIDYRNTGETSQDLDSQTPHEDSEQIVEKLREKPKRSGNNKMGTKNGKSKKHNRA